MTVRACIFDWGNTLMRDYPDQKGPMYTWSRIGIMPGADDVLKILAKKVSIYIATNAQDSTKNDILLALDRVNIRPYVTDVFCFREIGYAKPSAEFFRTVLGKIAFRPDEILFVGDDPESDVMGAEQHGLRAVLYDPSDLYCHLSCRRIRSLAELREDLV